MIKDTAGKVLSSFDVESMKAKIVEAPEELDLLEELLGEKDTIKIPKNPELSYKARIAFVQRTLNSKLDYLQAFVDGK